ncbi:MAG: alpha-E domain-containing protein [Candidatus Velthaea sp.]
MLSRFAESFYWLSRNVERAETVARVLDVTYTRAIDMYAGGSWAARSWRAAHAIGTLSDVDIRGDGEPASATVLERCAFDAENPSSIVSTLTVARANAIGVRAELSTETWEHINELYLEVNSQTLATVTREGPSRFLRRVRDRAQAIAGVSDGTLLHVDGWNFLQLGRYFERASLAVRMLATMESMEEPWPEWQRLLEMCCASVPFARASTHQPSASDAVAFILFNATFPRSLQFCASEIEAALHRISGSRGHSYANEAEKLAGRFAAVFDFSDIADVIEEGVPAFLRRMSVALDDLTSAIQATYFPRIPALTPMTRSDVALS